MTALNGMVHDGAVYLVTSSAAYRRDGVIDSLTGHAPSTFPHLKMAVATAGLAGLKPIIESHWTFSSYDDAIDGGAEDLLFDLHQELSKAGRNERFNVLIAGCSDERGCAELYAWRSFTEGGVEPFALVDAGGGLLAQPTPSEQELRRAGLLGASGKLLHPHDPVDFLGRLLDAQRHTAWSDGTYNVGGSATLVKVDAAGVTERVIRQWPADRVGERIEPSTGDHSPVAAFSVVVPMAGYKQMSRAERRKAEHDRRRGRAA